MRTTLDLPANRRVVLLYSGGLDSTVLLGRLLADGHSVTCLGFHYGQTHARELVAARRIAALLGAPFHLVSVPALALLLPSALTQGGHRKVVPNRNAVLINIAVGYAAAHRQDAVALAANANDGADFNDCRPEFLDMVGRVALANGVDLWAPFIHTSKADIVAQGYALGLPVDDTRSCYRNDAEPCRECDACRDRAEAFGAVPG